LAWVCKRGEYRWLQLRFYSRLRFHIGQALTREKNYFWSHMLLEKNGLLVDGLADTSGVIPDDPDDERILACAIDGRADLIVSGDRHLLDLESYADIPIITVRDFLERLEKL
jgi:predicted nucleic acid-binding protein